MAAVIRHIATGSTNDDLFATAEFERSVSVWSFKERRKVVDILTHLDFGGRRLAMIGGDDLPKLAVGAYNRYGVTLYDALSGEQLWQRSDLKGIQFVNAIPVGSQEHIGVGRETGSFHILDVATGETITSLRGIKEAFSSSNGAVLAVSSMQIELVDTSDWAHKWRQKAEVLSRPILDVALSAETIAVSYMGGPVRFLDMNGKVKTEFNPGSGRHVLRIVRNTYMKLWVGIEWNYSVGGDRQRLLIDDSGIVVDTLEVGGYEHCFFHHGTYLISSDGEVRRTDSNDVAWRFE